MMLAAVRGPQGHNNKRSTRACDRCYRKACKCSPGIEGTECVRCNEEGVRCTYDRPVKRRGPHPRQAPTLSDAETNVPVGRLPLTAAAHGRKVTEGANFAPSQVSNLLSAYEESVVKPEVIELLVEVFHYACYPTRPYVHWPTYQAQIRSQDYRYDWGLYVVTMAVCAMSAGGLSHGLPTSLIHRFDCSEAATISARCYAAAVKASPNDITAVTDYFQMMKASAILAAVCLQNGDSSRTLLHIGDYISLSILNGFYDEANWPKVLTEIQRQERRRLFWGVYQQEQYISNDFGLVSRQREAQATVLYPAEVFDDEDITENNILFRPERVSFLRGWNFCTDLYRLLENTYSVIRARQHVSAEEPDNLINSFLSRLTPQQDLGCNSLQFVTKLYDDLPVDLTKVKAITQDPQRDRYSFIAFNVLITTQVLKMLLVGSGEPSVHQRCAIVSELLDELSSVPLAFFHATSMASLRHLAHVGHVLASVIKSSLPAWTYLQVRSNLLVLAEFLGKVESARPSGPNLSLKLRKQIDRIDQCMKQASQNHREPGLLSMGQQSLLDGPNIMSPPLNSNLLPQRQPSCAVHAGSRPLDVSSELASEWSHHQNSSFILADSSKAFEISQQTEPSAPVSGSSFPHETYSLSMDPLDDWLLSLEQAPSSNEWDFTNSLLDTTQSFNGRSSNVATVAGGVDDRAIEDNEA